jgi:hypothetical protein
LPSFCIRAYVNLDYLSELPFKSGIRKNQIFELKEKLYKSYCVLLIIEQLKTFPQKYKFVVKLPLQCKAPIKPKWQTSEKVLLRIKI